MAGSGERKLDARFVATLATACVLAVPQPGEGGAELPLQLVDGGVQVAVLAAEIHMASADVHGDRSDVALFLVTNPLGAEGEAQDGALCEVAQMLLEGLGELLVGVVPDGGRERHADGGESRVQDMSLLIELCGYRIHQNILQHI